MNEITRKATNALVATVDFFSGALAEEARAGEEKQRQLDALAGQLKAGTKASDDLDDAERELAKAKDEIETLRLRVSILEAREQSAEQSLLETRQELARERKDRLDRLTPSEARAILNFLQAARTLRDSVTAGGNRVKGPNYSRFVETLEIVDGAEIERVISR